jgi:hypothetical protein
MSKSKDAPKVEPPVKKARKSKKMPKKKPAKGSKLNNLVVSS